MQALWKLQFWKDLYTIFDSKEVKDLGINQQGSENLKKIMKFGRKSKNFLAPLWVILKDPFPTFDTILSLHDDGLFLTCDIIYMMFDDTNNKMMLVF